MIRGLLLLRKARHNVAIVAGVLALTLGGALRICGQAASFESPADVVLTLSGPEALPLFSKGQAATYRAVLVNHSGAPFVFVPPHADWLEERHMEWRGYYTDKRDMAHFPNNVIEVDRVVQLAIWCDVHGTMRGQNADFFYKVNQAKEPRQIRDADLVVLPAGGSYELPGLSDPRFILKFLRRGAYGVKVDYEFDPSRYKLAPGSTYAAALARAKAVYLASNTLSLTLN